MVANEINNPTGQAIYTVTGNTQPGKQKVKQINKISRNRLSMGRKQQTEHVKPKRTDCSPTARTSYLCQMSNDNYVMKTT